ncbi:MAG: SRPBCC domain-containing protein [Draconibacterium sp.]|nr:SRPBCC domain-containing protein [Draconibacterium sp.]
MKKTDPPILVEESYNVPILKVWDAITDLDEMKLWYFDNIDNFQPEIGSKSRFQVQSGERIFTHLWEVTEVNVPTKIIYSWKYEEYQGDSFVSFELEEFGNQTRLILRVEVIEDFADNIPEFERDSCVGGWQYFLKKRLKEYLT